MDTVPTNAKDNDNQVVLCKSIPLPLFRQFARPLKSKGKQSRRRDGQTPRNTEEVVLRGGYRQPHVPSPWTLQFGRVLSIPSSDLYNRSSTSSEIETRCKEEWNESRKENISPRGNQRAVDVLARSDVLVRARFRQTCALRVRADRAGFMRVWPVPSPTYQAVRNCMSVYCRDACRRRFSWRRR